LIATRGFIYEREIKKRIIKISDLLEEGITEMAAKVKRGTKAGLFQTTFNSE